MHIRTFKKHNPQIQEIISSLMRLILTNEKFTAL